MNLRRVYQTVVIGILWLCLGAGCHKESPILDVMLCKAGCCYANAEVRFAAKLNGALLSSIGQEYINLKEPAIDVGLIDQTEFSKEIYFAFVCPLDESILASFNTKRISDPNYKTQQYKIWGTVYQDPSIIPFNPTTKVYAVKIDKIEKAD